MMEGWFLISGFSPQFWILDHVHLPGLSGVKGGGDVKDDKFPDLHIGLEKHFLHQKNGPILVNFSPCGPIYILQAHIGGRHPVTYLRTQMTKR